PLAETALGSPADLHETEVVGPGAEPAGGSIDPTAATMSVRGNGGKGGRNGRNAAWMRQTGSAVKHGADEAMGAADAVYGRIARVTHAEGAGASGLAHVIELNAVAATGDLLVTVALATSLFFSLQPGEARPKVALYL